MAETQVTTKLTANDFNAMIRRLSEAIGEMEASKIELDDQKTKELWVFKVASWKLAVRYLDPFIDELRKARLALNEGKPQDADTRKTRAAAKKVSESRTKPRSKRSK